MTSRLDPNWLHQGHFDLHVDRERDKKNTRTIRLRDALADRHGRRFEVIDSPPGPVFKDTYYWREPGDGITRAQYIAHIDESAPVMFLGLSIEKGAEIENPTYQLMDRRSWDWSRLVALRAAKLTKHVASISASVGRPVYCFVMSRDPNEESESECFVFLPTKRGGRPQWWQRREGLVGVANLKAKLDEADALRDSYTDVWIVCPFSPRQVARLTPDATAAILYEFHELRAELRGKLPKGRPRAREAAARKGR